MKYTFVSVCSMLLCASSLFAQDAKPIKKSTESIYTGTYVGYNLLPTLNSLSSSSISAMEFSVDVGLKQKYFPVVEFGLENRKEENSYYYYRSNGVYGKFGVNYNFLKATKKTPHNLFYIGGRYALGSAQYALTTTQLGTNYWNETGAISMPSTHSLSAWGEIVVGVRAEMFPSFLLGANVRYAFSPHFYSKDSTYPTYLPGYGEFVPNKWLFAYSITYKLPF
ncbi:MAG: hypothetical protein KA373_02415 [Paludibacteraceae bacterium]|nr:hypothetical protein [Paludibacteraceae bacterium]